MALSLLSSATMVTACSNEINDPSAVLENEINDSFAALEQEGFTIITSGSTYSFDAKGTATNLLFDQESFSLALSQSKSLNEMIYNGSTIAVFDDSNELHNYEETLGLPIGFIDGETLTEKTHKTIGYIYQSDAFGGIHITRVNTKIGTDSKEHNISFFVDAVINKNIANGIEAKGELDTEFLGSITDYYVGSEKGDISVAYEVSTAQEVDNYDYYVVHAYIDATPGDSLYGNKYDADILTTNLHTWTSDAVLYKTAPNTMSNTTSYSVDIDVTSSKDGINGSFNFDKDIPDVDISKSVKSSSECEWEVDIDDLIASAADNTLSFEPGGTFRVEESNNRLSIVGTTEFVVDAWNESPSTAVYGLTCFYCSSGVEE